MSQQPTEQERNVGVQDARRSPRVRVRPEPALCNLGEVVNLSNTGVCLRTGYLEPGSVHVIVLRCLGSGAGPVRARVVWSKKVSLLKYESGLRFVDVDVHTERTIARVVSLNNSDSAQSEPGVGLDSD
jgi:hypothetical protein